MAKIGRPTKPHHPSWGGDPISGFTRQSDGRWRIISTGERFTEADEHRAVQRFVEWKAKNNPGTVNMDVHLHAGAIEAVHTINGQEVPDFIADAVDEAIATDEACAADDHERGRLIYDSDVNAVYPIPERVVWPWLKLQLTTRPDFVAKMVGIPELAGLRNLSIPKPSLKLDRLLETYKRHADVKSETKREAGKCFDDFVSITGARTLDDLTTEALVLYRDTIKNRVASPGTVAAYFGRAKSIIAFAKTEGLDAVQIDAALSRMAVLKAPKDDRTHEPTPISPEDFRSLYEAAGKGFSYWQHRLLLMLNLCLHFDECLDLVWTDFDLQARTFCTKRNKRGKVMRAAYLWPETMTLLKVIPRTGSPHVFVSSHGKRFNARGQWKTWNKLRTAAKCRTVQMDDIRDGAYSAACNAPGVDEKFARLLAGHRSDGNQDKYVRRNPAVVRPACEAVYEIYSPFNG